MKNNSFLLALLVIMIACAKNDEVVTPDAGTLEWRSYSVSTTPATEVTSFTATSGGTIGSSGGGNSTSERGICYNTAPNPTISNYKIANGSGAGTYVCVMTGLAGNTLYYIRAYAIKSGVTTYGNQVTVTTYADPGSVTDYDGNVYSTINIGGQIWMLQNLRTTHYQDGTLIPEVPDSLEWYGLSSGASCFYQNSATNLATYGRLYNWYAATDTHNLAPAGWHVPSAAEWTTLSNYLSGDNTAGGRVKESGYSHWNTPNSGATNSSMFTALPGGARFVTVCSSGCVPAYYGHLLIEANWWTTSTSTSNPDNALSRSADNTSTRFYRSAFLGGIGYYDKRTGYSIRCVKN
ncbi:MAG TPA: fibrobacter succinogenes major paralogous domain-containing protein [Saprospiraceae bacterium]|nr:fibrobacter succinogenes major paralogous domain-containing protein [Saprospiraceae bacterium]